jgi:glycosyltransferase involved in cell wall biosynthesis
LHVQADDWIIIVKILMITDFYWPFLGGVEQHVRTLSHALVARGHQVAVATLWNEGLAEQEEDAGVQVYRLHSTSQRAKWLHSEPKRPWAPPIADPQITFALQQILGREQPQIVHGHDWLARSFLPLKATSRAKLVISLHYYTYSCAKKNLMYGKVEGDRVVELPCCGPAFSKCLACGARHYGRAKGAAVVTSNWGMRAVERAAVDMFVSVSQATAEGNGLANAKLPQQVIPNFLPSTPKVAPESLDSYLSLLPAGEFMLFVGDLRPIKGLDVLLEAYSGLQDARPLVLIGKTWPDSPAHYPPNTLVLNNWPNAAVLEAWRRSTIALVPSIWAEPFGIVVIEAMAGGTPVIASKVGGIPEIVTDGESGLLVPPGDASALRSAIERLLTDVDLRQRMSYGAKQRAGDFAATTVVPRIEEMYQSLLTP